MTTHEQTTRWSSPWSFSERAKMAAWQLCWALACSWTPKPFNGWRLFWLKLFGAKISGNPFVHSRARVQIPWNLTLEHRACLGDRANAYSLGPVILRESATVAQEAYLCTGTHNFDDPSLPLQTAAVVIEQDAFIGARALILPGVRVGANSVVGAGSVVTRDVPAGVICAGNPARVLRPRSKP